MPALPGAGLFSLCSFCLVIFGFGGWLLRFFVSFVKALGAGFSWCVFLAGVDCLFCFMTGFRRYGLWLAWIFGCFW